VGRERIQPLASLGGEMPDMEFPRCRILLGRTRARKFVRVVVDFGYAALGPLCETELYFFQARLFVPFLYRRLGKMAFLALLALREFNNLRRINQVISSTPTASTNYIFNFNKWLKRHRKLAC